MYVFNLLSLRIASGSFSRGALGENAGIIWIGKPFSGRRVLAFLLEQPNFRLYTDAEEVMVTEAADSSQPGAHLSSIL